MSCEQYRNALTDVAAGGAGPAEAGAHLASCAACRAELALLREALGLADAELRAIASAEPSPALRVRIRQAVAEDEAGVPLAWRWVWPATAAAVLLVAVAAGFWRAGAGNPRSPIVAVAPVARTTSPRGGAIGRGGGGPAGLPTPPSATTRPASTRSRPPARHAQPSEPQVLVPPGQQEALLRFVALVHRERLAPPSFMAAGEPSPDLVEPKPIQIQPLEIVPLDPAESSGT